MASPIEQSDWMETMGLLMNVFNGARNSIVISPKSRMMSLSVIIPTGVFSFSWDFYDDDTSYIIVTHDLTCCQYILILAFCFDVFVHDA